MLQLTRALHRPRLTRTPGHVPLHQGYPAFSHWLGLAWAWLFL